jgi:hypothetical protein
LDILVVEQAILPRRAAKSWLDSDVDISNLFFQPAAAIRSTLHGYNPIACKILAVLILEAKRGEP